MTTDREALIAGIAADPDNDLRRLVFADWLEEHGEPERAEFTRLQIEARHTPTAELKPLDFRARALFRRHGAMWFAPFLRALDPHRHVPTAYFLNPGGALSCAIEGPRITPPQPAYLRGAAVRRGFVELLTLNLAALPKGSSVGAALAHEQVSKLNVFLTAERDQWKRFSEPGLRHVTDLFLEEEVTGRLPVACLAAFSDSHLPAVRKVELQLRNPDAQPRLQPLPFECVRAFEASPLAYRVSDLKLRLDDVGLRILCRSGNLQLDKLNLTGSLTRVGIRALIAAAFAPALRSLKLTARLTDDAVAALAEGTRFQKLVELDLSGNPLTDAGVRALAAARFTPQLEVLDVSDNNEEFTGEVPTGVLALADALNPDCLRMLRLCLPGFDHPPAVLTARFGDRVKIG